MTRYIYIFFKQSKLYQLWTPAKQKTTTTMPKYRLGFEGIFAIWSQSFIQVLFSDMYQPISSSSNVSRPSA